ncbi:hypothetical protein BS47DRAFT_525612 [Hydnum rufescens UP504]|uniref:Uncharacterized protein n=1 Tax=Hydnum rufescens UP504 TaxID=1448309 RepID=A0A9P6B4K0_9AGAM|nr:hypothetical protein BS47DRAFT_525612 [Hydnum rufescens UP504]
MNNAPFPHRHPASSMLPLASTQAVPPEISTSGAQGFQYRQAPQVPSSPPESNLLMRSFRRSASVDIGHLITSIQTAPPARILRLIWFKGARHQFLLLELERLTPDNLWVRLDKGPQRDWMNWVVSATPSSGTTAELCSYFQQLIKESGSRVKVQTVFQAPPSLDKLGVLLSILEGSFTSKTSPEDAFFCAVVYENLFALGWGEDIEGSPSTSAMAIAPDVRAKIRNGLATFPASGVHHIDSRESLESRAEPESSEGSRAVHEGDRSRSAAPTIQVDFRDISEHPGGLEHQWRAGLSPDLIAASSPTDWNDGAPRHPEHRSHTLPSGSINFSSASVQSNLFSHSWRRPFSMALTDLASYIDTSPNAHIIMLKWCKDLTGVPHEFLLLNVELHSHDRRTLWLRLDRRSHRNATTSQFLSSTSASADTAIVCESEGYLFDNTQHGIEVQTTFTTPLPLETLRDLLFIVMEESPNYKVVPENCMFFCSVIYEDLVSLGRGWNIGVPSRMSMALAPSTRARIRARRQTL